MRLDNLNNLNFNIEDENGQSHIVKALAILNIKDSSYLMYTMDKDESNCNVYASKLITFNNQTKLIEIDDEEEHNVVYKIVNTLITISDNKELSRYLARNKAYLQR